MNCPATTSREGSIGVYKEWLGHSVIAITE